MFYVYIYRDTHITYSYMSIYRDGGFLLLYICVLNMLLEQLVRMLGTTIIKTTDAKGML